MISHPVPEALQTLVVKGVIPNAEEVEGDEDESDEIEAAAHDNAVPDGEETVVEVSVADEDVAVAAHGRQRHQGTHAGDGAYATYGTAKSWKVAKEPPAQRLR